MKHDYLDRYSRLDSPLHRLSPVLKLILTLIFLVSLLLVPANLWLLSGLVVGFLILFLVAGIPLSFVARRTALILPLLALITVLSPLLGGKGKEVVITAFSRALLSILALILLSSTTRFSELLSALKTLRFPRIIILVLSYMYRYFFVLTDQAQRMILGARARAPRERKISFLRLISHLAGTLFVRSYERSERVYQAMVMRGFDGDLRRF